VGSRRPLIVAVFVAATVAAAVALCACGGGSSKPVDPVDALLAKLEAFQTRGCACADAACFQAVQGEMETWVKAHAANVAGAKATKAQGARAATIDAAMVECQERFGIQTEAYKRADAMVSELRGYKERYCACSDAACIAIVDQKMKLWATARAAQIKQLKPTKKQDAAAAAIEAEIKACVLRVGGGSKPPEPPATP
jgi:hypothetical protein